MGDTKVMDSHMALLYYTPGTCSLACQVALEWRQQPYQLCRVNREERASQAFLNVNPKGQVPALREGDRVLLEGCAIMHHLCDSVDGALAPLHSWEHSKANEWLNFLDSGFHAAFYPYFRPQRFSDHVEHHEAIKARAQENVRAHLDAMNSALANRSWLVGNECSLVDAYLVSMLRWADAFVSMVTQYPHLERHRRETSAHSHVAAALAIEACVEPSSLPINDIYRGHVHL